MSESPRPAGSTDPRGWVPVNAENVDRLMAAVHPSFTCRVENRLCRGEYPLVFDLVLVFASVDDLDPVSFVHQIARLEQMLTMRDKLAALSHQVRQDPELAAFLKKLGQDPELTALLKKLGGRPEGS
jgi:type VI secretion system ImpB/VipA family protein